MDTNTQHIVASNLVNATLASLERNMPDFDSTKDDLVSLKEAILPTIQNVIYLYHVLQDHTQENES